MTWQPIRRTPTLSRDAAARVVERVARVAALPTLALAAPPVQHSLSKARWLSVDSARRAVARVDAPMVREAAAAAPPLMQKARRRARRQPTTTRHLFPMQQAAMVVRIMRAARAALAATRRELTQR